MCHYIGTTCPAQISDGSSTNSIDWWFDDSQFLPQSYDCSAILLRLSYVIGAGLLFPYKMLYYIFTVCHLISYRITFRHRNYIPRYMLVCFCKSTADKIKVNIGIIRIIAVLGISRSCGNGLLRCRYRVSCVQTNHQACKEFRHFSD